MIEIVKFNVKKYIRPVAVLYDRIFAAPPWNDKPKGEKVAMADILKDLAMRSAQGLLAISREEPIGFAWGFQLSTLNFAILKYSNSWNQDYIYKALPKITGFYVAEVAILENYRKKGLATAMVSGLTEDEYPAFMRTMKGSPMEKIATNQLQMSMLDIQDPEDERRVIYLRL